MEAASLVFSAAQTLFAALQSKELKQICSLWSCESELESLQDTVNTIKSVLLDAGDKKALNHQQQNYVEKLKAVVYDADDLLDEFTALVEQQQHLLDRGMVPNKVRILFSRFGKLNVFRKMSKTVKKIRKELDGIASDASQFSFKIDYEPIRRRREETCSYVHEKDVIGREKETEEIINMLLASDSDDHAVQGDLSVVAIVGMGGLGKTTLAQHIYEHDRIKSEFQLRLWACVADQNPDQLLLQPILAKILESATGTKDDGSGIELVQKKLREQLQGKKYLLALDDVWIENHNEWLKLETFLLEGGRGSRIMVTTRSEKTAQAVGSINSFKLQELSEENSWHLFEKVAFDGREGHRDHHELVKIGKEIVKKCSNVPLSIRVVGGLLYGQEKKTWLDFQQRNLAKIIQGDNTLMPVLKLSYHHLQPAMKSCFSYCALFPKDAIIKKDTLIGLWMAQGYIEPLRDGQSIEDAGEDYFLILLRRCFFQDVKVDELGEIVSCKMHDLMHDMAQQVAGNDICVIDSTTSSLDEKVRHVCAASYKNVDHHFFNETKIRTCIRGMPSYKDADDPIIQAIFTKWTRLRVLDFRFAMIDMGSFSDSMSNLLHLRYIDLTDNVDLERLPESVTQLRYLQTLILNGCGNLIELPKGFSKLVKLRFLDIDSCWKMSCMPSGMDKLTSLRRLTTFFVSEISGESDKSAGGLEELRALEDLRGRLTIEFRSDFRYVKEARRQGRYLSNKKDLNAIVIKLYDGIWNKGVVEGQKELLEDLQPHENLKELQLWHYDDVRMPRWAKTEKLETSLPNLVKICLIWCSGLRELPSFSKLQHLKSLQLRRFSRLEHVENTTTSGEKVSLFPLLEILILHDMEELKGWWSESVHEWMSFPRLSQLTIEGCPNLQYIPGCPMLETLSLRKCNEKLRIMIADEKGKEAGCYSRNQGHGNGGSGSLRSVQTDNGRCLEWIRPISACRNLKEMKIRRDMEMESMSQVGEEVLHKSLSSLQSLQLDYMPKLRNLSGLEHLTALEYLSLYELDHLSFDDNPEEEEGMPWRCLSGSLKSLGLYLRVKNLPKGMQHLTSLRSLYIRVTALEALPEWIDHLSSLQILNISHCKNIESLPRSMRQLSSLNRLEINYCSQRLHQRCQSPDGEDWPLIHHIPHILIE